MMESYPKIPYDYENIKYSKLYEDVEINSFNTDGVNSKESVKAIGKLMFPNLPQDRTYTLGAFVTSIDGKIAYPDNPFGPMVASTNYLDPIGAGLDFWILNFYRASMDAIFIGAGTMQKEPDLVACIYDEMLEKERVRLGLQPAPIGIICSLDGKDIPFEHDIFKTQSVIINTSPKGMEYITEKFSQPFYLIGPYESLEKIDGEKIFTEYHRNSGVKVPIIVTGEGYQTDSNILLRILKILGIHKAIVESPSFTHSLMKDGLLDELVQSFSAVYIGGKAISIGSTMEPFMSLEHPHMKILSIAAHLPGFLYFRYKILYNLNESYSSR